MIEEPKSSRTISGVIRFYVNIFTFFFKQIIFNSYFQFISAILIVCYIGKLQIEKIFKVKLTIQTFLGYIKNIKNIWNILKIIMNPTIILNYIANFFLSLFFGFIKPIMIEKTKEFLFGKLKNWFNENKSILIKISIGLVSTFILFLFYPTRLLLYLAFLGISIKYRAKIYQFIQDFMDRSRRYYVIFVNEKLHNKYLKMICTNFIIAYERIETLVGIYKNGSSDDNSSILFHLNICIIGLCPFIILFRYTTTNVLTFIILPILIFAYAYTLKFILFVHKLYKSVKDFILNLLKDVGKVFLDIFENINEFTYKFFGYFNLFDQIVSSLQGDEDKENKNAEEKENKEDNEEKNKEKSDENKEKKEKMKKKEKSEENKEKKEKMKKKEKSEKENLKKEENKNEEENKTNGENESKEKSQSKEELKSNEKKNEKWKEILMKTIPLYYFIYILFNSLFYTLFFSFCSSIILLAVYIGYQFIIEKLSKGKFHYYSIMWRFYFINQQIIVKQFWMKFFSYQFYLNGNFQYHGYTFLQLVYTALFYARILINLIELIPSLFDSKKQKLISTNDIIMIILIPI